MSTYIIVLYNCRLYHVQYKHAYAPRQAPTYRVDLFKADRSRFASRLVLRLSIRFQAANTTMPAASASEAMQRRGTGSVS